MPLSAAPGPQRGHGLCWLPAAVGTAVTPLLRGPRRSARVVSRTRDMIAVLTDGPDPALVCLTSISAVRLPCAMVLSAPLPTGQVGTPAAVGNGRLRLPTAVITIARWWPARPPHVGDPPGCSTRVAWCPEPTLDHTLLTATDVLGRALTLGQPRLADAVQALLGLGPGLTPAGDDVLAGALATLRAVSSARADQLADAVAAAEPFTRTTAVSAGLLAYAAHGRCVPQVTAFLTALDSPTGDVTSAYRNLLAVGHTSGSALYAGIRCALAGSEHTMRDRSRP